MLVLLAASGARVTEPEFERCHEGETMSGEMPELYNASYMKLTHQDAWVHDGDTSKASGALRQVLLAEQKIVRCMLLSGRPFLLGRPGGVEVMAAMDWLHGRGVSATTMHRLHFNAGVKVPTVAAANEFARAHFQALNASDLVVRWGLKRGQIWQPNKDDGSGGIGGGDALLAASGHWPRWVCTHLVLEPWEAYRLKIESWTTALRGRTVLIVSAFNETIRSQLHKFHSMDPIWGEAAPALLPRSARIKLVRPPLNLANAASGDATWHDSLATLIRDVEAVGSFDLALVACGGIGMNLAVHIRHEMRRSAMYVGGVLQLYFGVWGTRWGDTALSGTLPFQMHNKHAENWTRPSDAEKPPSAKGLEKGAYWRRRS